jgi:triphosphoribosyl-dephospho-CoA synthase
MVPKRATEVATAAQLACLLEVSAAKPGNVSPGRHFPDARYEDFLASAVAIGGPLSEAGTRPVGATIRLSIEATRDWAPSNTNLGLVLLLAPLARAAMIESPVEDPTTLRSTLRRVLADTTVNDAIDVYAAIRLAAPGGLGRADSQDVASEPTMTLVEVMQLAAGWDGIAREYATGFNATFETGRPALCRALSDGLSWGDAVVETFLQLLAVAPDTHVVRRRGAAVAEELVRHAEAALTAGGVRSASGRQAIAKMDDWLRAGPAVANPGTTADITAAAIFVVLLGGGWISGSG